MRILVADDEYVGVGGEEWRRMGELMVDFNVTYVQTIPRAGLSAGRNALVENCVTKYVPPRELSHEKPMWENPHWCMCV